MLMKWNIVRYARCYSSLEEQYLDCNGKPFFDLFPSMKQRSNESIQNEVYDNFLSQSNEQHKTLLKNHTPNWTAISSNSNLQIFVSISIFNQKTARLEVECSKSEKSIISKTIKDNIILERLKYPEALGCAFYKVSPRQISLGFRYSNDLKKANLFQIIMEDSFSCRLLYDQMNRFGLISNVWSSKYSELFDFSNGMHAELGESTEHDEKSKATIQFQIENQSHNDTNEIVLNQNDASYQNSNKNTEMIGTFEYQQGNQSGCTRSFVNLINGKGICNANLQKVKDDSQTFLDSLNFEENFSENREKRINIEDVKKTDINNSSQEGQKRTLVTDDSPEFSEAFSNIQSLTSIKKNQTKYSKLIIFPFDELESDVQREEKIIDISLLCEEACFCE